MKIRNFREMLEAKWASGKFVCVGLDSELKKIPGWAQYDGIGCAGDKKRIIIEFNRSIVEATKNLVCAYKPNIAFYEAHGAAGIEALYHTIADIGVLAPDVPVILDAKRADIGNTNAGYVELAFDYLRADAITVHPYLGSEALQPFLARAEKGVIVLCRTSNPGATEFQNARVVPEWQNADSDPGTMPFYQYLAIKIAKDWNKNGNCGLVVGATYPAELETVRHVVGDMPILIPGIGAQGGDVKATVTAGKDSRGRGMIINSSRGIIFASNGPDFAEAARRETQKLHDLINQYR